MTVKHIETLDEFLDEIHQVGTVVVKVSTSTCGPCKMMAPVFEKASEEDYGSIKSLGLFSHQLSLRTRIQSVLLICLLNALTLWDRYATVGEQHLIGGIAQG